MMAFSFTLILAILAFLGLTVIFGVTFAWKGIKTALISTGAALVLFAILYVALIALISSSMN